MTNELERSESYPMVTAYRRASRAKISLDAIIHNYQVIKQSLAPGKLVYATVKADAYGHGAKAVSQALSQAGVDGFCVALTDEALELRQAGIQEDIMVLGVIPKEEALDMAQAQVAVTVSRLDWLETVSAELEASDCPPLPVHLAVDSGMGRIGFLDSQSLQAAIDWISAHPKAFTLKGIFTHFATADSQDPQGKSKQAAQAQAFQAIRQAIDCSGLSQPPLFHQSNSAMALWYPDQTLDMVRLGIALYGANPSNGAESLPYPLEPALSLETEIAHVKQMHAGETVGYGATYTASQDEWIATLPIGYADGWLRAYSGLKALIQGQPCPIVGRICMDQCMVRLDQAYPIGTPVTLIGKNQGQEIRAEEVAAHAGTIAYETFCLLSQRLPRTYQD
ncbi:MULTISPECIES: alanine racemase [unclassified Aerococcus]|uniref:alanine racemase n=1 Tax=unclassified Aerococcus TaxID=2618060 RepID=UPI001FEFE4D5|nr:MULTISPECIES: alanine racemase [unclassified Aerococcus]MDK6369699.1 alanine racemase [Aerococcus sp. UMB9870]MDK6680339.1 alanine racemase [Aerococcus sp. UMB8608]MDK6686918.1 alanine racemase [Aerococcus sp. UMB8623]